MGQGLEFHQILEDLPSMPSKINLFVSVAKIKKLVIFIRINLWEVQIWKDHQPPQMDRLIRCLMRAAEKCQVAAIITTLAIKRIRKFF